MLWTKTLIPTLKETPQEAESAAHRLMLRAGLIRMLLAGVYSYLPLGLKVLNNIETIIREELNAAGAAELLLPALQPQELWVKSGRDKEIGEVMFRFVDRKKRSLCLGPTHEEVITELARNHIFSYKQLPMLLYQIQTKFRDEIRPRYGLVRACEFVMKDAYSFDKNEAGLEKNYRAIYDAYHRIFKKCGLQIITQEADPGLMGGNVSHEFMAPAESGEDVCNAGSKRVNAIELGHIFKLGTKYSSALQANFLDADGKSKPLIMGCYGIGVSRMAAAIIEQNYDADGIIWPMRISPYKVIILPLDVTDEKIMQNARDIYRMLESNDIEALLDDRDERAGVKFKDADLIGIPVVVTLGKKALKEHKIEIKTRRDKDILLVDNKGLVDKIKQIIKKLTQ